MLLIVVVFYFAYSQKEPGTFGKSLKFVFLLGRFKNLQNLSTDE